MAVNIGEVATPLEFVVAVTVLLPPAKVPLAPVAGAVKVTTTPPVGDPLVVTVAPNGEANAVLTAALCGVPLVGEIVSVAAVVLVRLKLAGVDTPATEAVTVYVPVVPLAVNTGDVATPLELVVAVAVLLPPAKVPLAPVAGAVKVTTTPLVGDPLVATVAANGDVNAVLTAALCGVPLVAVIVSITAPVFVRLKLAGVDTPATVAVTM